MTGKEKVGCVLGGIIVLGLIPIPYQASPAWSVKVIDESGNQLEGMTVRMTYENYSVEATSHEEDKITDADGRVEFPPNRASASMLRRLYFTTLSAGAVAHASFGPNATVFTFGKNREGSAVDHGIVTFWSGKPDRMESTILATVRKD